MAKDPSGKEFLTENEFKRVVAQTLKEAGATTRDMAPKDRQIQDMFDKAEGDIERRRKSGEINLEKETIFKWKGAIGEHEITYKRQPSAAQQILIHSQHTALFAKPKEYLTRKEFKEVLEKTGTTLSTEQKSRFEALFRAIEADSFLPGLGRSQERTLHFSSPLFTKMPITIHYMLATGTGEPLVSRQHLGLFKPAQHIDASTASDALKALVTSAPPAAPLARKKSEELGEDWLKYDDVLKGMRQHLIKTTGTDAAARSRVNVLMTRIREKTLTANGQEGEVTINYRPKDGEETSATIRYHKYGVKNIASLAIHRNSLPAFYEVAASPFADRALLEEASAEIRRDNLSRVVR